MQVFSRNIAVNEGYAVPCSNLWLYPICYIPEFCRTTASWRTNKMVVVEALGNADWSDPKYMMLPQAMRRTT